MVLGDITNVRYGENTYTPSCQLPAKYRPLIIRGQRHADQTPRADFPAKREAGDANLDLWVDGELYPENPRTKAPPPFKDLKGLLCYVGDGVNGLLGYTNDLASANEYAQRCKDLFTLAESLTVEKRTMEVQFEAERDSRECDWRLFSNHVSALEFRHHNAELATHAHIQKLNDDIAGHIADKARHIEEATMEVQIVTSRAAQELERVKSAYEIQISSLKLDMLKTQNNLLACELRQNKRSNPGSITAGGRLRKNLANLAPRGGRAKRVKHMMRELIQPETVAEVRESNLAAGSNKKLCGDNRMQSITGAVFGEILSQTEVQALMADPKFQKVAAGVTNEHMKAMGKVVNEHKVLGTMDQDGIPHRAYNKLVQIMKTAVQQVDKNLRFTALPNAFRVGLLRTELNSKLKDYIGDFYHINDSWEMPVRLNEDPKKRTGPTHLHLNKTNNLFVDLETVQRSMVRHYEITSAEVGEGPLIFVLKMDEAEIVKSEKFERVSITLMNRALNNPHLTKDNPKYFSVQVEHEIWPIGTFRVMKESHECLKWVLQKTAIPEVVKAQSNGRKLVVENVGEFLVEWHLACDMKTVKCLYGFSHGANSAHSCMYCWQTKPAKRNLTAAEAKEPWKFRQPWDGGLFARSIQAKPTRGPGGGPTGDGKWSPIIDIPITRVHFCTLHAMCRIIEKIVHLQISYVWLIKDSIERKKAVADMEEVLSKAGLCGGAVVLQRDPKLSGTNSDLPSRISFNGAKCRKMFKPSSMSNFDAVWKDVCEAEHNNSNHGRSKQNRQEVWATFTELLPYFQCLTKPSQRTTSGFFLTVEQRRAYKGVVERWGKAYVTAYGEGAVTHYVHVIVKHSSWFVSEYGSLAVWSTQGMEKSHYEAKTAYTKHTQHDGTEERHSSIVQTFEWWYRVIQEKEHKKEEAKNISTDPVLTIARELAQKRR